MRSVIVGYVNIKQGRKGGILNKDIWTYFEKYVPHYFNNTDILLFDNDTIKNLSSEALIEKLNSYDNIILCGREPLKVLGLEDAFLDLSNTQNVIEVDSDEEELVDDNNEDSEGESDDESESEEEELDQEATTNKKDSRIDNMRYHGLLNNNPALKFKKIHVIYSLMYYIAKDRVNVFYFDILNRTNSNTFAPKLVNIDPKFHHISELKSVYDSVWCEDDEFGFDYESRGFPYDANFRLLGFSLANDKYQAYFYFSRDDIKYFTELKLYEKDIKSILKDEAEKLWVFNNKFENNATHHALKERVFYQDTRVFVQMMKTRGTLKFNANLLLNVPIWNDSIMVFMKNYKLFVKWMQTVKIILDTYQFENVSPESLEDTGSDLALLNAIYNFGYSSENEYSVDYKKAEKILTIKKLGTSDVFKNNPGLFFKTVMELVKEGNEVFNYFFNYNDKYVEGNFNILSLLECYFNNYNEWQATPIGDMGYYCILDGYYTYKIKEMCYDGNFHGCKDGYPFYISQTNHASLIESNGVYIDSKRFDEWSGWVTNEIDYHARWIALYPEVKDEVVKSLYQKTFLTNMKFKFTEFMSLYMKVKRGFDKILGFLIKFDQKNIPELFKSMNKRMYENRLLINQEVKETNAKLTKTQYKKKLLSGFSTDEAVLYELLDLTNKKIIVGFESFDDDTKVKMFTDHFMKKFVEFKTQSDEANSLEDEELRYIDRVNSSSYDKLNDLLGFSSTKDEVRKIFSNILVKGDREITLLRFIFVRSISSSSHTGVAEIKKMDIQELMKFLTDNVNAKIVNDNVKAVQKSLLSAKTFVESVRTGKKFDRDTLRYAAQGHHQYLGRNAEKYEDFLNTLSYETEDPYIQFIYHFQLMKRCVKSISTMVKGSLGAGSAIKTHNPNFPVKSSTGSHMVYKTTYWNNDKDTLRWSSAYHTIPSESDFSLCYTPREEGKLFFHMDRAQAEVRIAFAVAKEEGMVQAIAEGLDIHSFNTNKVFNLGYEKDTLHLLKNNAYHDLLRSYSKMISFAILYGAGAASLAKSMKKPLEEGIKIINDYYKGNPKFKEYIDWSRSSIKENFGLLKLPIFNHLMFIGNPFHYSLNQKALNYQIQNISSSLTSHSAFHLYLDLMINYMINIDHNGFIHDAIEFEFFIKDIFKILDRVEYWYKTYDFEELGIPSDYDYEVGLSKYSVGLFKYEYSEDKSVISGTVEVKNYYEDDIDRVVNMFRNAFDVIEDRVEDKGLVKKYPFTFQVYGNKPHNMTQTRETKKYIYHFKLRNKEVTVS